MFILNSLNEAGLSTRESVYSAGKTVTSNMFQSAAMQATGMAASWARENTEQGRVKAFLADFGGPSRLYIAGELMPVAPGEIETTIDSNNDSLRLASGHTMKILQEPGLARYTMEILLPSRPYDWATYEDGFKEAQYFLDLFSRLKNPNTGDGVFRIILIEGERNISQNCTLEDYKIISEAEEVGDIRVELEFERYDPHTTQELDLIQNEDGTITATLAQKKYASGAVKKVATASVTSAIKTYGALGLQEYGDFDAGIALMKAAGATHQNISNFARDLVVRASEQP